jgi:hypothetical protein
LVFSIQSYHSHHWYHWHHSHLLTILPFIHDRTPFNPSYLHLEENGENKKIVKKNFKKFQKKIWKKKRFRNFFPKFRYIFRISYFFRSTISKKRGIAWKQYFWLK